MSLILDALRKSEAERRGTQVPDLLAQPRPAVPARTPIAPWAWLLAGLAIAITGVALWRVRDAGVATTTSTPAPSTAASSTSESSTVAPSTAAPSTAALSTAAPSTAVPPSTNAPSTPARASTGSPTTQRPATQVARVPAPATPGDQPPQVVAQAAAPGPLPPRVSVAQARAPVPNPGAAAAPAPAVALPPPGAPAPSPDAVLRIADLDPEARRQLPPLKLSMHMWNEVPAQRFVIIDGTRLAVGDHLGELVVADIARDGVVLDWNGRLLKLPLR